MRDRDTIERLMQIAKAVGRGELPLYQHKELFTAGAFDLVVFNSNDKGVLFELLSDLCAEYECVKSNEKELSGFIYLLEAASRSTGTTELPSGMERIIRENPEKTGALREWYRLRG